MKTEEALEEWEQFVRDKCAITPHDGHVGCCANPKGNRCTYFPYGYDNKGYPCMQMAAFCKQRGLDYLEFYKEYTLTPEIVFEFI